MNRRDLLKFFGAGTIIAPLAAEAPLARIIEPPKVELFKAIPEPIKLDEIVSATLTVNTPTSSHALQIVNISAMGSYDPAIDRLRVDLQATRPMSPTRIVGKMFGTSKL